MNGLNRELPFVYGKDDHHAVRSLAGTAQSIAYLAAGILFVSAFVVPFFIDSVIISWTASMVLICSSMNIIKIYLWSTYRAGRAFNTLAKVNLAESLVIIASLPLVFFLGYPGFVVRIVFIRVSSVILSFLFRPLKVSSRFQMTALFQLLRVGVPIFIFGYIYNISNTFPKIIMLTQEGVEMVGIFAPALALIGLFNVLPLSLARYIYPHMSYRFGQTSNPMSIWPAAWKSALGVLVAGAVCALLGSLLIGPFIKYFIPKYKEVIPATYWCLAAGIFLGPRISVNALFTLKAWKLASVYSLVFLAASWGCPWLGVYLTNNPLIGMGIGIFVGYFIIFLTAMPCVYFATHKKS